MGKKVQWERIVGGVVAVAPLLLAAATLGTVAVRSVPMVFHPAALRRYLSPTQLL